MATSIRTLVLRVVGDSTRNIHHVLGSRVKHSFCNAGITVCRGYSDGKSTHFGFETVPEEDKAERVYKVFESVAKKYDVMNDAMSLGIHRLWKDTLLHIMNPQPGLRLLDTAGGTGDISFRFLEYTHSMYDRQQRQRARSNQTPSWQDLAGHYKTDEAAPSQSRAVVYDINKEMLKVGKQKAEKAGIGTGLSWVMGDAEELPFDDDQFDIYTIAFGIRNVTHIEQALQEAFRVLKPGGRFLCLEFSKVSNPLLERLYDTYSFQMIPVLGEVIAGDWKSYQYLVESIRKFPDQETFKEMIEGAGFFCVQYFNLTGGIVAIHSGFKL
ncbi:2-methoxy-6-polyprenyl-1,4-benzoquinol methylase, mitochondrial-like [Xyrauchen texanus]|uniref:2-methoxy-6-polyprenyl-1,4-benzoquinol methylase, mitochondrial-like n=1 Tax=Xyrauchen texanus TaxID=154827 RepID=UPI00224195B1|nr:2-methoxy-6-polyprenyl-1,4-benzoquinol methylase, mitochondrial-like [Xyrauchen texanus]